MTIPMQPVTSSQIESIGHDPSSNTLAVKFKNGGTYHYHDVGGEHYKAMVGSSSVGGYLSKNIKSKFKFTKA